MKSKIAGILILVLVILAGGGYYFYSQNNRTMVLRGYLGGEKTGLFEDEEVQEILQKKYHMEFDYARAGSLDMITADHSDMDYLFLSSQTALALYEDQIGDPVQDQIIFNTPIVLYTHQSIKDAFQEQGAVTEENGVFYMDMEKLVQMIMEDTQWADIGLGELYGRISVDTTDPVKSNSGNMFAALLASVLNGGETVNEQTVETVLPELKEIYSRLGYMETSSSDIFDQFLKMGIGAKPMIAGYESQILEFAAQSPEDYEQLKEDIVMIYPTPTVWSTHVYIALDDQGKNGAAALLDEDVQRLAWEKHGFRTNNYETLENGGGQEVEELAGDITRVVPVPDYPAMKRIIEEL